MLINPKPSKFYWWLLGLFIALLVISAIKPHDYFTWFLEVCPALAGAIILIFLHPYFRLSPLTCTFIFLHAVILLIGGHYTYAQVPLFNWLRDDLHLRRNVYDRVGHFAQGFVPALIIREVLIRNAVVRRGAWLALFVLSLCLAISALYELFEWGVAAATGQGAEAFLGTQGDPWDTQWDMFTALIGAITALLTLSHAQDKILVKYMKTD